MNTRSLFSMGGTGVAATGWSRPTAKRAKVPPSGKRLACPKRPSPGGVRLPHPRNLRRMIRPKAGRGSPSPRPSRARRSSGGSRTARSWMRTASRWWCTTAARMCGASSPKGSVVTPRTAPGSPRRTIGWPIRTPMIVARSTIRTRSRRRSRCISPSATRSSSMPKDAPGSTHRSTSTRPGRRATTGSSSATPSITT